jgi:hypothetical protein
MSAFLGDPLSLGDAEFRAECEALAAATCCDPGCGSPGAAGEPALAADLCRLVRDVIGGAGGGGRAPLAPLTWRHFHRLLDGAYRIQQVSLAGGRQAGLPEALWASFCATLLPALPQDHPSVLRLQSAVEGECQQRRSCPNRGRKCAFCRRVLLCALQCCVLVGGCFFARPRTTQHPSLAPLVTTALLVKHNPDGAKLRPFDALAALDPKDALAGGGQHVLHGERRRVAAAVAAGVLLATPVLLEGPPAVGKTSLVAAMAAATGRTLVRVQNSATTSIADYFGRWGLGRKGGGPGVGLEYVEMLGSRVWSSAWSRAGLGFELGPARGGTCEECRGQEGTADRVLLPRPCPAAPLAGDQAGQGKGDHTNQEAPPVRSMQMMPTGAGTGNGFAFQEGPLLLAARHGWWFMAVSREGPEPFPGALASALSTHCAQHPHVPSSFMTFMRDDRHA